MEYNIRPNICSGFAGWHSNLWSAKGRVLASDAKSISTDSPAHYHGKRRCFWHILRFVVVRVSLLLTQLVDSGGLWWIMATVKWALPKQKTNFDKIVLLLPRVIERCPSRMIWQNILNK